MHSACTPLSSALFTPLARSALASTAAAAPPGAAIPAATASGAHRSSVGGTRAHAGHSAPLAKPVCGRSSAGHGNAASSGSLAAERCACGRGSAAPLVRWCQRAHVHRRGQLTLDGPSRLPATSIAQMPCFARLAEPTEQLHRSHPSSAQGPYQLGHPCKLHRMPPTARCVPASVARFDLLHLVSVCG